jgi:hypothetical protein
MAHLFKLNKESLKREFSAYVVIIRSNIGTRLYIGKTGDNREGCNPIISRCGNHFSYNHIHSQIRNAVDNHEDCDYTYIFNHFGKYSSDKIERKIQIDQINEMERWLNIEIQALSNKLKDCNVVNPFKGSSRVSKKEKLYRNSFHTSNNEIKIKDIVQTVSVEIGS